MKSKTVIVLLMIGLLTAGLAATPVQQITMTGQGEVISIDVWISTNYPEGNSSFIWHKYFFEGNGTFTGQTQAIVPSEIRYSPLIKICVNGTVGAE